MKKTVQILFQSVFLLLFLVLLKIGRVQVWMGLFLIGLLLIPLAGRIYCGWICPINTGMQAVSSIKKRMGLKSAGIPSWMRSPLVRYGVLLLFIGLFAFSMVSGNKLPVLPVLFVIGVLSTLFYPETVWHRYLCPYGSLMTLPGRFTRRSMAVDPAKCIRCDACRRVCPAVAVQPGVTHYTIRKNDCMVCMHCQKVCKPEAISYGK